MKKIFILLFVSVTCIGYAQQQDEKKKNSYWSVTLEGGFNRFDGDVTQKDKSIDPSSSYKVTLGGSVEYTLTPVWSMGLEYYNIPLQAKGSHFTLKDKMNTADIFLSLNFIKWFYPKSHSKWGVWATLGGGAALYDVNYQTESDGNVINGRTDEDYVRTNRWALTVPVGALIEYNFTKNFALGAKLQYRAYNKDNLDGRNFYGVTNDFVSLATMQLRWKFNAHKKDHTRNINTNTFYDIAERSKVDPDQLSKKLDSLQSRLDAMDPKLKKLDQLPCEGPDSDGDGVPDCRDKEPNTPKGTYVDVNGRAIPVFQPKDKNGNELSPEDRKYYTSDGPDDDKDGVPNNRDKEPNTPKNTPVDFWGRSLSAKDVNGFGSVYFDFDKTNLDAEAERTIKIVAEKMKDDVNLMVEVRGYCDYIGSFTYNQGLSNRRAEKVKAELVNMYGIAPSRIITNGKGKLLEPKTAYRLNRRCNFFFDR